MSKTITIDTKVTVGNEVINGRDVRSAGQLKSIDEVIAGNASGVTVALAIDVSAMKMLVVSAIDGPLVVTFVGPNLEFSIDGGETITYVEKTDVPKIFGTTDVTSVGVSNEESTDARLRIEVLLDPTP